MAAEGDYIMINKNLIGKKCHCHSEQPLKGLICDSGQGLCNSKSMYKVDLHMYVYV